MVVWFITVTASGTPFNVTTLNETPCFFEKVGVGSFYNKEWVIISEFRPQDITEVLSGIQQYQDGSAELCRKMSADYHQTEYAASCQKTWEETNILLQMVQRRNRMINTSLLRRKTKRAIDSIGEMFQFAFGTMDHRDAAQIYEHLQQIDKNEDRTYQHLNQQITVAANNYEKLAKPLLGTMEEVEVLQMALNRTMHELEVDYVATTVQFRAVRAMMTFMEMQSAMNSRLCLIQNQQELDQDILEDIRHGFLHPMMRAKSVG